MSHQSPWTWGNKPWTHIFPEAVMQTIGLGNINRCPLGKEFGGQESWEVQTKKRIYPLGPHVLYIFEGNCYRSHSHINLVKRSWLLEASGELILYRRSVMEYWGFYLPNFERKGSNKIKTKANCITQFCKISWISYINKVIVLILFYMSISYLLHIISHFQ